MTKDEILLAHQECLFPAVFHYFSEPLVLTRAKDQLKGNILMGLESSNARMANLARQEMYFQQFYSVDEIIARIEEVDANQVQTMAQRLFEPERIAVTLLGRLDGVKLGRSRLVC